MKKNQIIITGLGNTLEWFDFGLFIFMAPLIGAAFFPQQSAAMATLDALMVFAAGFICRPLGGIFFGHYGDTRGRAKILRLSILMITLSTLLIGVLPSYQTAGIIAPVLFALLRLIQGLSIGGEYSGVMIYLAESAPKKQRGFITSFAATGANAGFLLATVSYIILKACFTSADIAAFAWRIPFLLAGLPGTLVLYYRFKLSETRVYAQIKSTHHIEEQPFFAALKYAPYQLLKIAGLACMSSSFYYVFFGYMPTYLNQSIGLPLGTALRMQTVCLIAMFFIVPFAGFCGDYFSRKKMLVLTSLGIILLSIPCFYLIQTHSLIAVMTALSMATVLSSYDQGNSLTAVVENCPPNVRYSGIAFSYNIGMALFGGTAPLVVTALIGKFGLLSPAYYLMAMAGISLFAAANLLGKNQSADMLAIHPDKTRLSQETVFDISKR